MASAVEQFMRENRIRKLGLILADDLVPHDSFSVELEDGWLAAHIGIGPTPEAALASAHQRLNERKAA